MGLLWVSSQGEVSPAAPQWVSSDAVCIPPLSSPSDDVSVLWSEELEDSFCSLSHCLNGIGMSSTASERRLWSKSNSFGERKSENVSSKPHIWHFQSRSEGRCLQNCISHIKQSNSGEKKCIFRYSTPTVQFSVIHYNLLQSAKNYSSPIAIEITEPRLGWGHKLQQTQATKIEHNNSACPVSPSGMDQWQQESETFLMWVQMLRGSTPAP